MIGPIGPTSRFNLFLTKFDQFYFVLNLLENHTSLKFSFQFNRLDQLIRSDFLDTDIKQKYINSIQTCEG